jgi:hypothetical protein
MYPAPPPPAGRTEGRTFVSLLLALFGLLIGLVGLLLGGLAVVVSNGDLLNGLLLGLPAMVCGPIAYFLGRSAISRIKESPTTLGGQPTAVAGWVIGAVGTALGALSTLTWLVLLLIANFGPPPA